MHRIHRQLLAVVVLLAIGAAIGIVVLWPSERPAPQETAAPLVDGVVRRAEQIQCPEDTFVPVTPPCLLVDVEVLEGPDAGLVFQVDTGESGTPPFAVGERVRLYESEAPQGAFYAVADYDRLGSLGWLVGLFVVAVLTVGRWHGLRSLISLGLSLVVVTAFFLPAILDGRNPLAVATVGAFTIMIVTLYLSHGFNVKTTTAVVGTAAALALTGLLGAAFAAISRLTGLAAEDSQLLANAAQGVSLSGLVLAGLIISALGVLDDVTVTQASAVFAVHDADPRQSWGTVFRRAMNVGRDHIASTVNTLVLAYAGASITLLLLFSVSERPILEILNSEIVATEIVKTLVGSIGLIAAVPLTTVLATTMAVRRERDTEAEPPSPGRRERREAEAARADFDHEEWLHSLGRGLSPQDRRGGPDWPG